MSTNTHKTLTLSRNGGGGGSLTIHPEEWPALVQAVTEALQLDAEPAVSLEELPVGKHLQPSPLGNGHHLAAHFERTTVGRHLSGYHRSNFGSD